MLRSSAVDGFSLAYDPTRAYSAQAQADSVLALMAECKLDRPVIAGYDVGSRIAQQVASAAPGTVRGLVIAPPVPGAGRRVLGPDPQREFWYQAFHRLDLAEQLIDGNRPAVQAYLRHFWTHWSGPGYEPEEPELERLTERYGAPGAFTASIGWYRAGSGTIARSLAEEAPRAEDRIGTPTTILWPEHDPLFPLAWSDRIDEFFSAAIVQTLPGAGHFTPLEAPAAFAGAIAEAAGTE